MRRNVIDRLALLCTLHADGPKTLRLLREAGCTTLDRLRDLEPNRLAKILSLSPAAGRRLLREGVQLQERLEPALDREEVMYPPAADSGAVEPAPPGTLRVDSVLGSGRCEEPSAVAKPPAEEELTRRADLGLRDRRLLDEVVDRWRRVDESSRREAEAEPPSREGPAPTAGPILLEERPADETERVEKTEKVVEIPVRPPRTGLRPGELNGLDQTICEVLGRGGITCLEELASCPIEELVERSRLSFTRARTLQFLAGRRLAQAEARESASEPASPMPRPAPFSGAGGDEGAGGPFA